MKKAAQKTPQASSSIKPAALLIGGSFLIVLLVIVFLPFFNTEKPNSEATPVGVIAQYPEQFTGNTVDVVGEITDRVGYRGFKVKGQGLLEDEIFWGET